MGKVGRAARSSLATTTVSAPPQTSRRWMRGGDGETGPTANHRAPDVLASGTQVGRYRILEPVGAGAMGTVYAAHDPDLDRRVALKLLHSESTGDELGRRLLREAKAMARLSHPEVITVYDVGHFGARLFVAMELVNGKTLRDWIAERPRSWREVLAAFIRAGRGLADAHAAGLVHRDFKPDNVLVGHDGRVRVTDFGLARVTRDLDMPRDAAAGGDLPQSIDASITRTGSLMGTPAYMSPEQLSGAPADSRSDLFSFSVAVYEGLYGERPFPGTTVASLHRSIAGARIRPPRREFRVPSRVRRALLRGMHATPGARFASMDLLLDVLESTIERPQAVALAFRATVLGGLVTAILVMGSLVLGRARSFGAGPPATTPAAVIAPPPSSPTVSVPAAPRAPAEEIGVPQGSWARVPSNRATESSATKRSRASGVRYGYFRVSHAELMDWPESYAGAPVSAESARSVP